MLLLMACADDGPPAPVAPVVATDPAGLTRLLTDDLRMPAARLSRLQARIGPACAVVVDPADPAGCDVDADCVAMAFSADEGHWNLRAMATTGTLPATLRCADGDDLAPLPGG
jgi:hypothetical protein